MQGQLVRGKRQYAQIRWYVKFHWTESSNPRRIREAISVSLQWLKQRTQNHVVCSLLVDLELLARHRTADRSRADRVDGLIIWVFIQRFAR